MILLWPAFAKTGKGGVAWCITAIVNPVGRAATSKERFALSEMQTSTPNAATDAPHQHLVLALEQNKRVGLTLAVRARWVALSVTAVLLVMTIPSWDVLYYHAILIGLALIGWLQLRIGKVGRSRWELALIFLDISLMVLGMLVPNPFLDSDWPSATQYKLENFKYFYIFLAATTLGYSWRTVVFYGVWTAGLWLVGMVSILFLGSTNGALTGRLRQAVQGDTRLLDLIDPNIVDVFARIEEVSVLLIVAGILAINSFRMNQMVLRQAGIARERSNLARYFPPNIVDRLAERDKPLGAVRAQEVAVMFADIVGFTRLAERDTPEAVVTLLRDFHRLIEETVFEHGGTLDKYLGDGAMVTFGTPDTGLRDASDALQCAETIISRMAAWNTERRRRDEPTVSVSLGLHFGPAILGDIGTERRLEFATLGDTVNVASRLEELTREFGTDCIISDQLVEAAKRESGTALPVFDMYHSKPQLQTLRGRDVGIKLWVRKSHGLQEL